MEKEKLENIKELLIVVDMVNGFVREGSMADPKIEHIIPRIEHLVNEFLKNKEAVAFIKDTHDMDAVEFKRYPVHCVKKTRESELVDELKKYENMALVYEKNSTSAIFAKNFKEDIAKMKKLQKVTITGCCTDICVMNLAIPLQNHFDEVNKDVAVEVVKDAVETYDAPNHKANEWNENAFRFMNQAGIKLVKTMERK